MALLLSSLLCAAAFPLATAMQGAAPRAGQRVMVISPAAKILTKTSASMSHEVDVITASGFETSGVDGDFKLMNSIALGDFTPSTTPWATNTQIMYKHGEEWKIVTKTKMAQVLGNGDKHWSAKTTCDVTSNCGVGQWKEWRPLDSGNWGSKDTNGQTTKILGVTSSYAPYESLAKKSLVVASGFESSGIDGDFKLMGSDELGALTPSTPPWGSHTQLMYKDKEEWKVVPKTKMAQVLGNGDKHWSAKTTCDVASTSCGVGQWKEWRPLASGSWGAKDTDAQTEKYDHPVGEGPRL